MLTRTQATKLLPPLVLVLLPALVHLPALAGGYSFDPINLVSGLADGTWQTNGLLRGYPWLDANAGVTTEALGGLAAHDWLAGILPWWNPFSGVGMPLAAAFLAQTRTLLGAAKGSPLTSSMYRDLMAQRPIEADQIVGDLLARARGASLSTPLLAAAYTNLCVYERRRVSAQSRSSD